MGWAADALNTPGHVLVRIGKPPANIVIDPFGGAADLKARILRHVGQAFVEDPVRILRVARFAARFDFAIAPETMMLMRETPSMRSIMVCRSSTSLMRQSSSVSTFLDRSPVSVSSRASICLSAFASSEIDATAAFGCCRR